MNERLLVAIKCLFKMTTTIVMVNVFWIYQGTWMQWFGIIGFMMIAHLCAEIYILETDYFDIRRK